MLFIIILAIAVISIFLSFLSLMKLNNNQEIDRAKKDLSKGKIVFHKSFGEAQTSSSSESESSGK